MGVPGLVTRTRRSPQRTVPFDWPGQILAVVAMGGLTYGAIESGAARLAAPRVVSEVAVAVAALAGFLTVQARGAHPVLPLDLFRSRTVAVGFAFVVGYYRLRS